MPQKKRMPLSVFSLYQDEINAFLQRKSDAFVAIGAAKHALAVFIYEAAQLLFARGDAARIFADC